MARLTKEQKQKALNKWAKAMYQWYQDNYGDGVKPMIENGPPPPPPKPPELP